MKFVCPACERIVELASFRVIEGALHVTCSRCAVESKAETPRAPQTPFAAMPAPAAAAPAVAPASRATPAELPSPDPGRVVFLRALGPTVSPASRADPFAVPDTFCPKCVSQKRPDDAACASCGLVFANFQPEEHAPLPLLADAWLTLAQTWEDNAAHDRFLQLAMSQGRLATAGRLYRIQLAHHPDDPYAQRGRDEVLRLAAAASPLVAADVRRTEPGANKWKWNAVISVMIFLAALYIFVRRYR